MAKTVIYLARIVALIWAGWWTLFGLLSGIGEGLDVLGVIMHLTVPGLIFLAAALVAWRWEVAGGILLVVEGVLALFYFPFAREPFGLLTLALPPVIAGVLFLIAGLTNRHHPNAL